MPFLKQRNSKDVSIVVPAPSFFVGRTSELLFFMQNILLPEIPVYNILSISGQGGVGKSTLLNYFRNDAHSNGFKEYCLTALVDERQTSPFTVMERFAEQLPLQGKFKKAFAQYKEVLLNQKEPLPETIVQHVPDLAGAAVEGLPLAGPFLREGVKTTSGFLLGKYQTAQIRKDMDRLTNPIDDLTKIFVDELNQLVTSRTRRISARARRDKRIILFFDTFEHLASEVVPWLLDHFLEATIDPNIVLVIAGRNALEHSSSYETKRWLPYVEDHTIYSLALQSFTEDETRLYLTRKGIIDPQRIASIWQLSQGLPLYLGLLTSNLGGDVNPAKGVIDNFLHWIPSKEYLKRQLALDASLFSKPFNQDDLGVFAYLPKAPQEQYNLYQWLIEQSFVRSLDGQYLYHDVAKTQFQLYLYQSSPKKYYDLRISLAHYYERILANMQLERDTKMYHAALWLEVVLALLYQLFALLDEKSHIKAIEYVLSAYKHTDEEQHKTIIRALYEVSQEYLFNQGDPNRQHIVKQLIHFGEFNRTWNFQERLAATTFLIEKVTHEPTFSSELLAYLHYQCGIAHNELREHQQSLKNWQKALELLDSSAHPDRGWIYFYLDNVQQAVAEFSLALVTNPHDARTYSDRGWMYMNLKNYTQAIADFDQALQLEPDLFAARRGRGAVYTRLKQYTLALIDIEHSFTHYSNKPMIYLDFNRLYISMKEYQRAKTYCEQALLLTSEPRDLYLLYLYRGKCFSLLQMYQKAFEDFDRALAQYPEIAAVCIERGHAYLRQRDLEQARINFTQGWEAEPEGLYGYLMAEWVRLCQNRFDSDMLQRLTAALENTGDRYYSFICKGMELWLRKQYEEALVALKQTLHFWRESWGAFFWLAMTYASLGQDEEAMNALMAASNAEAEELSEMPPVLLLPLRWFEQERPEFYKKYAEPLLVRNGV